MSWTVVKNTVAILGVLLGMEASAEAQFSWESARDLVRNCAVQPIRHLGNGKVEYLPIRSYCPEMVETDGTTAKLVIRGRAYIARLMESAHSDGGDLNDITVETLQGKIVAQANNILAFDDVLLAFIGNDIELPQILED